MKLPGRSNPCSIFIFALLIFFSFYTASYGNATSKTQETRIIMDEDFNWLTKEDADNTLKRIKEAGFNVFMPCVWHGGGVTWVSDIAKERDERDWRAKKILDEYDPLEYLIDTAHEMGIEVHPWFTISLRYSEYYRNKNYHDDGTPEKAFNIHNKDFRIFISDLVIEVISKYDVDGINLDYVRSKGFCTSEICKAAYREKVFIVGEKEVSGRNLLEDISAYEANNPHKSYAPYKSYESYKNKRGSGTPEDYLTMWNVDAVTDIIKRVSDYKKKHKKNIMLSIDTHPTFPILFLQGVNSIEWLKAGLIDMVFDMQYYKNVDKTMFDKALSRLDTDELKERLSLIVSGYESSPKDAAVVSSRGADMVSKLISEGKTLSSLSKTIVLYEYRFLTDAQINELKNGPFKEPAIPFKPGEGKKLAQ